MADIFKGTPFEFGAWALNWRGTYEHQRLSLWPDAYTGELPDKGAQVVNLYVLEVFLFGQVEAVALAPDRCELRYVGNYLGRRGEGIWRHCLVDLLRAGLLETREQKPTATRGAKAGTLERVREAHRLLKSGMSRNQAFKRARVDSRTYDQWCKEATGGEPLSPYRN